MYMEVLQLDEHDYQRLPFLKSSAERILMRLASLGKFSGFDLVCYISLYDCFVMEL